MSGIPIEGPTKMFYNNKAVYKNALTPELTLKKKYVSIFYYKCRRAVADGVAWIAKEGADTNFSDLITNMLKQIICETLLEKFTY